MTLSAVDNEKLRKLSAGEGVVMSDSEFERLCGHFGNDIASMKNPDQVGILDYWFVASRRHPTIQKHRALLGLPA